MVTGAGRGPRPGLKVGDVRVWLVDGARLAAAGATQPLADVLDAVSGVAAWAGREAVGREVATVLGGVLASVFESGWQPIEVARIVRQRRSGRHDRLLVTAMAHDIDWNPRRTPPPPSWADQLETLGVSRWWGSQIDWLQPWARRAEVNWDDALRLAVEALGVLALLPKIEPIVIPPSGWHRLGASDSGPVAVSGMLAKVRALLAKAESTSFEAEAAALTAKAQQLIARHSIDDAMARRGRADPGERPAIRRTPVDGPYANAKCGLLHVVARANGVRSVWYADLALMALVGYADDLDAVDVLFTSLLVQATKAMVAAPSTRDQASSRPTRSYRQSFLVAFAGRIRERLAEAATVARRTAEAELGVAVLPVLVRRDDDVERATEEWFPHLKRVAQLSATNDEGWMAGRTAAELADLGRSSRLVAGPSPSPT
jgi:hypothetical protein